MTKLLDRAVAGLQALPPEAQDDVARLLLQWVGEDQMPIQLTAEDEASFAESLAQADRRDFASDEDVEAIWAARGVNDRSSEPIDPADSAAVAEGLTDVRVGRIASDAKVEASYASFKSLP